MKLMCSRLYKTYRAIVLINPAAATATATAILPNLKTKIVIAQSIFELV